MAAKTTDATPDDDTAYATAVALVAKGQSDALDDTIQKATDLITSLTALCAKFPAGSGPTSPVMNSAINWIPQMTAQLDAFKGMRTNYPS